MSTKEARSGIDPGWEERPEHGGPATHVLFDRVQSVSQSHPSMENAKEGRHFAFLEADVRSSESLRQFFQRVVENASEAVLVTGAQLDEPGPEILWVNDSFLEITGYEREEIIGETPRILQGPETSEQELQRLRMRLAQGERFEGETVNYRKDGTPYINHWSIAPVYGGDGAIRYWVSVQRDVTETRRLEGELLQVLDEERRRIGQGLHDSVGSVLTVASMRLDNLASLAESMEKSTRKELRNIRASIVESYDRLRRTMQGLSPMELVSGSLAEAIEDLTERLPGCTYECGIELDAVLSSLDQEALVNLYWIVYEAATNAQRHADYDTLRIAVGVEGCGDDTTKLRFVIEDDGSGFEGAEVEDDAWGMRLMKSRADLLGAELQVDSSPGEGTCVKCELEV